MLAFHPLADLFPMIAGAERAELVDDIRANGLRERIVMLDGKILDGRNRYTAAIDAGIIARDADPESEASLYVTHFRRFLPQQDGDPLAWVLSKNLHRRHLSESQRAMVARRLAGLRQGARTDLPSIDGKLEGGPSQSEAADLLHTSVPSMERAGVVIDRGAPELVERVEKGEVSVSAAAEVAKLPVTEQLRILREQHPREFARAAKQAREKPRDARAVMASRAEPDDSLDYFPTPPWATRALMQCALPELGLSLDGAIVREPACGEGHIAEVLAEAAEQVLASDIFDYSANGRTPPHWCGCRDYLDGTDLDVAADWVITNPPFEDRAQAFVLRALEEATVGVAMFVRVGWLDSIGRYEAIFRDTPPTMIAFFAERVNLCKGRWDPEGSTATAYCWLIWEKDAAPRAPFWIPPGQRKALARPDDAERFTAHPVMGRGEDARSESALVATSAVVTPTALPHPPGAHPVEFTVRGMRQTATATFAVRRDGAKFVPSFRWDFPGFEGSQSEASEPAVFFDQALRAVMDKLIADLSGVRDSERPGCTDKHRAAARGGIVWLEVQKEAWGLGAQESETRVDGAVGETASLPPDRPSVTSDELAEYKMLGAVAAGMTVTGPTVDAARAAGLLWGEGMKGGLLEPGWKRSYELDAKVRAASDGDFVNVVDLAGATDRAPMTFDEAKPVLLARYGTESGQALADELGIPLGTLRTWAFKLGLTGKARIAARGQAMVAEFNQTREAGDAGN